jgi:hypothetical protein
LANQFRFVEVRLLWLEQPVPNQNYDLIPLKGTDKISPKEYLDANDCGEESSAPKALTSGQQ